MALSSNNPRYLDKQWRGLMRMLFDDKWETTVPELQRNDMRKMFFSGATCYEGVLMGLASAGEDVTAADELLMGNLTEEIEEFGNAILSELSPTDYDKKRTKP